jgi:hypothetical protein
MRTTIIFCTGSPSIFSVHYHTTKVIMQQGHPVKQDAPCVH